MPPIKLLQRQTALLSAASSAFAMFFMLAGAGAGAAEVSGVLDVRAVAAGGETVRSWTREGLGKSRYDRSNDGLRLGQAVLGLDQPITDTLNAAVAISADDHRHQVLDLQEAWLAWTPLPQGAWRMRAKAGAFFPAMSLEVDYDRLTWTPVRTISASAINSWVGEELRSKGVEFTLSHLGRPAGSPNDFHFTVAAFGGNDPAGTLIAWRGWGVGDRITGLSEHLRLPDLPVYRPDGPLRKQSRNIRLFREMDGRIGYYATAAWSVAGRAEVSYMHYDNRADPQLVIDGQYGWRTKFDHVGMYWRPAGDWELMAQAMDGSTLMGRYGVYATFRSWYALASHPLGPGLASLRFERFSMRENDFIPADPNGEDGKALALAYAWRLGEKLELITECLHIDSRRPSRPLLAEPQRQRERSLTAALRWTF